MTIFKTFGTTSFFNLNVMNKNKRIYYFEISLYIFVSLVVLLIPMFMHLGEGIGWNFVFRDWIRLCPFFVIFLINNFLLAPKLLFKSKFGVYILSCIIVLLLVSFLNNSFLGPKFHLNRNNLQIKEKLHMPQAGESHNVQKCPEHLGRSPESMKSYEPGENDQQPHKLPYMTGPKPIYNRFFDFGVFIIGFLIMGFNSGVKSFASWSNKQEEYNEKERQYLSSELAFLKQQVSPHFFMNTLNNIHALIDIDSEKAKDTIIKLSKLMRYLLYESEAEKVKLSKEVEFLESYIELMRLRYDELNLSVEIVYPDNINEIYVPSLLFLPLVENAFKHGVQSNKRSFVNIGFTTVGDKLILNVKNSNFGKTTLMFNNEVSGIGLENIKKRLTLIYRDNYSITIKSDEGMFEVLLIIPIQ